VHEVLKAYLDDIATGTAPLSYEINSWEDLERWFFSNIDLQKKFRMTRGCPFGTIGNPFEIKPFLNLDSAEKDGSLPNIEGRRWRRAGSRQRGPSMRCFFSGVES
jgi:hypothetical protein